MNLRTIVLAAGAVALLALGACGKSQGDRALSGAAIGAGAGAVGSTLTGGSLVGGTILGGAAGAAAGALTDEDDIDLGCPVWDEDC
jgi:phage-related tail protein